MATADKYDRQLRLWGASGQWALSDTIVVLINATAAGTETLKNLVLPGVGAIHVVDGRDGEAVPVQGTDGVFGNFFVFDDGASSSSAVGGGGGSSSGMDVEGNPTNANANAAASNNKPSRAEVACRHLSELNPDVTGTHTTVPSLSTTDYGPLLDTIQRTNSGKGKSILIVASDLPPKPLLNLTDAAWSRSLPLLIVRTCGLIGSVRLQISRHSVVESKPDSTVPDLRLAAPGGPFPALGALADRTDLDSMDGAAHSHVPYVLILIKALARWRTETASTDTNLQGEVRFPRSPAEKDAFRNVIKAMARNYGDELNFQEASADSYLAYAEKDLPWEVTELLGGASDDALAESIRTAKLTRSTTANKNAKFDVLLLSLKKFLERNDGHPPLDGRIPDMTAGTEPYIALQEAYRGRADEDRAAMRGIVDEILAEQRGRLQAVAAGGGGGASDPSSAAAANAVPDITDADVATFCRNVHNLRRVETRSYADEWTAHGATVSDGGDDGDDAAMPTPLEEEIRSDLFASTMDPYEAPEHTPLLWHIALRSVDAFRSEHGRYPGAPVVVVGGGKDGDDDDDALLDADAKTVQGLIERICRAMGLDETDLIKSTLLDGTASHAREMVRYGNAELHNVASIVGGVASQEAVKLITGQYVPLDNTYVYDGIASTAAVYRF